MKSQTAILHNRKSSKETVVAKSENQSVDFHPNENGGTRILKGIVVAGREGEELSWKLEGMAEVKVSIWTLLPPLSHLFSLPGKLLGSRPNRRGHFCFVYYLVQNWH